MDIETEVVGTGFEMRADELWNVMLLDILPAYGPIEWE